MANCERTRCFLGHNFWVFDYISLSEAKIELSRVGKLFLAEHLQGTRVTLALGCVSPLNVITLNKKKCASAGVTLLCAGVSLALELPYLLVKRA